MLLPSVFFESFPTSDWSFLPVLFLPSFKSPESNKHDKQYMYKANEEVINIFKPVKIKKENKVLHKFSLEGLYVYV